jgi:hypothetical protein
VTTGTNKTPTIVGLDAAVGLFLTAQEDKVQHRTIVDVVAGKVAPAAVALLK